MGICRCYGRLLCDTKDTLPEVKSWKRRKKTLGKEWDDDKETERDAYSPPRMLAQGKRNFVTEGALNEISVQVSR